jgi:hypothetical protein
MQFYIFHLSVFVSNWVCDPLQCPWSLLSKKSIGTYTRNRSASRLSLPWPSALLILDNAIMSEISIGAQHPQDLASEHIAMSTCSSNTKYCSGIQNILGFLWFYDPLYLISFVWNMVSPGKKCVSKGCHKCVNSLFLYKLWVIYLL